MARPILGVLFLFLGINSVEEDTAYIRVVAGSIPAIPTSGGLSVLRNARVEIKKDNAQQKDCE